jgi:hypothetical protein
MIVGLATAGTLVGYYLFRTDARISFGMIAGVVTFALLDWLLERFTDA